MFTNRLTIIGVGNMGRMIALGLLDKGILRPEQLILSNPTIADLADFKIKGVVVTDNNINAINQGDIVLLAVKPQVFPTLLKEFTHSGTSQISNFKFQISNKLIISIAAGVTIESIKRALGEKQCVVRVMPNLCAMVGESMSGWVKSAEVTLEQASLVKELLQSIGKEVELEDERLIDAVTAVSGSGPAYVFYLAEILEQNAKDLGIPDGAARLLARQTIIGSAKVLGQSSWSAKELRLKVTSKGGTTEAAFNTFEEINLRAVFKNGIRAAWRRARELHLP